MQNSFSNAIYKYIVVLILIVILFNVLLCDSISKVEGERISLRLMPVDEGIINVAPGSSLDDLETIVLMENRQGVGEPSIEVFYEIISSPEGAQGFSLGESEFETNEEGVAGIGINFQSSTTRGVYEIRAYVDNAQHPEFSGDDYFTVFTINATDWSFEIKDGDQLLSPVEGNIYAFISEEPEMPQLKVRHVAEEPEEGETIEYRMVIQHKKYYSNRPYGTVVRNDIDNFPSEGYITVSADDWWDLVPEFGEDFYGGTATVYAKYRSDECIFTFYIRGNNPGKQVVKDYIDTLPNSSEAWFYKSMIMQESSYEHFNPYTYSSSSTNMGPEFTNSKGMPNWGGPNGWGMAQLDTPAPNRNQIWSWKENVTQGLVFLRTDKLPGANRKLGEFIANWNAHNTTFPNHQQEAHPNQSEGQGSNTVVFSHSPTSSQRSFRDAMWIKFYNGSQKPADENVGAQVPGWYLTWENRGGYKNEKAKWILYRTNADNHNYVEAVVNRGE